MGCVESRKKLRHALGIAILKNWKSRGFDHRATLKNDDLANQAAVQFLKIKSGESD
jgi:hypothetical protein